jgi:hypothetical protein
MVAIAACGGTRAPAGDGRPENGGGGVTEPRPPRESVAPCKDGVVFLEEGRAETALCPCRAPEDGAACCAGAPAWCEATSAACRFDRCATSGDVVDASCGRGRWHVKTAACRACPRECGAGELCVTTISREATATECVPDPCHGARPLVCNECAAAACVHGGLCAQDLTGGTHVVCLIPHS